MFGLYTYLFFCRFLCRFSMLWRTPLSGQSACKWERTWKTTVTKNWDSILCCITGSGISVSTFASHEYVMVARSTNWTLSRQIWTDKISLSEVSSEQKQCIWSSGEQKGHQTKNSRFANMRGEVTYTLMSWGYKCVTRRKWIMLSLVWQPTQSH